jgi:hypothetical protein
MQFEGAVIKEQGQTFAVVIVKPSVLDSNTEREKARNGVSRYFRGMPLILMAQSNNGVPTYHGRSDIAKFLASIDFRLIPWERYTLQ